MKARSRHAQRGSVIVEMVVVTPLLALLCGIAIWFWELHHERLRVYREVREPLFATATRGCIGGAGIDPGVAPYVDLSTVLTSVPGGPHDELVARPFSIESSAAAGFVAGKNVPGLLATPPATLRSSARMTCNEPAADGEPAAMKHIAAEAFSL